MLRKVKVKITVKGIIDLDPEWYPDGYSLEDMAELDTGNDLIELITTLFLTNEVPKAKVEYREVLH